MKKTFHDIFSKKQIGRKKEKPKIKILVDDRERNSLLPSELIHLDIQVEFKRLPVGDYLVDDVAVERKTINDLKSSIIDRRIFFQLKELQQYPKRLLVIEGIQQQNIYEGLIHENALRGFVLSTLLKANIPIIFTQNERDTARYLSVLARKEPQTESPLRQKINLSEEEQKQFILEGFPGIGPKTAKKLLAKFKSIKKIINADEKEIKEVLGKKTAPFRSVLD